MDLEGLEVETPYRPLHCLLFQGGQAAHFPLQSAYQMQYPPHNFDKKVTTPVGLIPARSSNVLCDL